MITTIEQILQADESARGKVDAARTEAGHLLSDAEQADQETVRVKTQELDDILRAEQASILADARLQASRIAIEADRYIEELQQKQSAIQNDLIERLLKKVVDL
jgi:vacuolar-type H+-ATPase subunit H